jgi:hypothetical protein
MMKSQEERGAPDAPIYACTLPPPELRRRRVEVLQGMRSKVKRIDETETGFVFAFDVDSSIEAELAEFVRFEAVCCSFITMRLEPHDRELELHLEAPPGARAFVRAEFVDTEPVEQAAGACCGPARSA